MLFPALLLIPCFINKLIFQLAKKAEKAYIPDQFYEWKYGAIHYGIQGRGKPILLVHGICIGGSHYEWQKNITALSKFYKVYYIDLLGFGFSDRPKITYTAYLYALLINDFIRDIIKKPVCAIGSSSSASFLIMACRLNPKIYNKLLLVSPTGIQEKMASNGSKWLRRILESPILGTSLYTIAASKKYIKEFMEKNCFFSKEKAADDSIIDTFYAFAHKGNTANKYPIASFFSKYMSINICEAYKELKLPTCTVWGENSHINPITNMDILEELKPQADYVIFEQTRLLPHYENAVAFNQLVKEFFK